MKLRVSNIFHRRFALMPRRQPLSLKRKRTFAAGECPCNIFLATLNRRHFASQNRKTSLLKERGEPFSATVCGARSSHSHYRSANFDRGTRLLLAVSAPGGARKRDHTPPERPKGLPDPLESRQFVWIPLLGHSPVRGKYPQSGQKGLVSERKAVERSETEG